NPILKMGIHTIPRKSVSFGFSNLVKPLFPMVENPNPFVFNVIPGRIDEAIHFYFQWKNALKQ
ncbi:hypothetical protein CEXT_461781, partial [Caerostris extrusa]